MTFKLRIELCIWIVCFLFLFVCFCKGRTVQWNPTQETKIPAGEAETFYLFAYAYSRNDPILARHYLEKCKALLKLCGDNCNIIKTRIEKLEKLLQVQ